VVVSILLIVIPTGVAIAAMLVVRHFAPPGGFLHGMESADGIFSAAGAGLAVLLAFVIFTVFSSWENAREGAGTEAVAAQQLYATAGFFQEPQADQLRGETVCYARAVIHQGWPAMAHEKAESATVQGWVDQLDATMQVTPVHGNKDGATLEHWFDVSQDRQEGRRARLAEAQPFVPGFVWVVLMLIVLMVVAFQCLFADPGATAFGQAIAMSAMTATLISALVLIWVLDRPFENRGAQIPPTRMQAALAVMQSSSTLPATLPCDADGTPR
jgi:hypothetical protein